MFQFIQRDKEYIYRPDKLNFKESKKTSGFKIAKAVLWMLSLSLSAMIVVAVFYTAFETPNNSIRKKKLSYYINEFNSIKERIDSLESFIQHSSLRSDKIYREVLELDSLSTVIRNAGIGGSNEQHLPQKNNLAKNISNEINQLIRKLNIQGNSFDTIYKEALLFDEKLKYEPGIQPVRPNYNVYISSRFGRRRDPFNLGIRFHKGIDFVGPTNCNIYATADGIVTLAKHSRRGYGNEVIINHKFGYSTRYAHLNKILVHEGEAIKRGQLIGLMGNSGRSTGTHLHYEVRLNKKPVNPIYYFEDDLTTEEYELMIKKSGQN